MSKYDLLWQEIQKDGRPTFRLSFSGIEELGHVPIDHSFLNAKKELRDYGYEVGKISMKDQTVVFNKIDLIKE
ncbi:hypothetical protein Q2T76_00965 [Lactobacillus sp. YT155]|uniref:hypothetical protein n=1 Tax=Lactobacillus sp. YT155 TaxID=3060955 RepID=UPI00265FDE91|nr:hypothetical protein [Lactobacillus sp. YT155]MDO1604620.1 hypothetical protein [Lactobacillus sp. YT155]